MHFEYVLTGALIACTWATWLPGMSEAFDTDYKLLHSFTYTLTHTRLQSNEQCNYIFQACARSEHNSSG